MAEYRITRRRNPFIFVISDGEHVYSFTFKKAGWKMGQVISFIRGKLGAGHCTKSKVTPGVRCSTNGSILTTDRH